MLLVRCYKGKIVNMFGLFKKKSKVEKLEKEYKNLLSEAHRLSSVDRKESDAMMAKAEEIAQLIQKETGNT